MFQIISNKRCVQIHYVIGWETQAIPDVEAGRECLPVQQDVPVETGLLLHLRRINSTMHPDEKQQSVTVLTKFAQNATANWQTIVNKYQLDNKLWPYYGLLLMQQIGDCNIDLYRNHGNICLAPPRRCADIIQLNRSLTWIFEKSIWQMI